MTREDAIKVLMNTEDNINYDTEREEIYFTHEWVGAYEMAISALREQDNRIETDAVKGVEIDQFKTNADHIRSMTDEELAEILDRRSGFCWSTAHYALEWLKQPYEEV